MSGVKRCANVVSFISFTTAITQPSAGTTVTTRSSKSENLSSSPAADAKKVTKMSIQQPPGWQSAAAHGALCREVSIGSRDREFDHGHHEDARAETFRLRLQISVENARWARTHGEKEKLRATRRAL